MSVNLSLGINPNKTKHLGPLFHTIDFSFETKELQVGSKKFQLKSDDIQDLIYQCNEIHANNGREIEINGYKIEVTKKEIERICETLETVKRTDYQRYRFFGK